MTKALAKKTTFTQIGLDPMIIPRTYSTLSDMRADGHDGDAFHSIIYVQGDESESWLTRIDILGAYNVLDDMRDYDYGERYEWRTAAPWGTYDHKVRDGAYVLAWNNDMRYVSLTYVVRGAL